MKKFFIKKTIIAKDIKDALRRESQSEVSEVYEDYNFVYQTKRSIGFNKNHGTYN